MTGAETNDEPAWGAALYDLLRENGTTQFAFVPDTGLKSLISRCMSDHEVLSIALTTEQEGVALLAGADLGGARGVLMMQSSGVGNCVNMLSLTKGAHFPLLMIVSMRGEFAKETRGSSPWDRQ